MQLRHWLLGLAGAAAIAITGCSPEAADPGYYLVNGAKGHVTVNPADYMTPVGCTARGDGADSSAVVSVHLYGGGTATFSCKNATVSSLTQAIRAYRHAAVQNALSGRGSIQEPPGWDSDQEYAIVHIHCNGTLDGTENPFTGEWSYTITWLDCIYWVDGGGGGGGATGDAGGSPGGGFIPADSAAIDNTGIPAGLVDSTDNEPQFDCLKVVCPSPLTIIQSPAVINAAAALVAATSQDSYERGAFLYRNPDGTIRVGPTYVGTVYSMPNMTPAPPDAIGAIHSHWGDFPPSGADGSYAAQQHINVLVSTTSFLYLINSQGQALYKQPRVP